MKRNLIKKGTEGRSEKQTLSYGVIRIWYQKLN